MRDNRGQFILFGVLPAVNALELLIYSIHLATGGQGPTGAALAVVLVSIGAQVLALGQACVRRARHLGWSGTTTLVVVGLSMLLVFPLPLLLVWLMLAPGRGADSDPSSIRRWVTLLLLLALPWMLALVAIELA
ncbi:MAG: hypothetical protein MUE35_01020 [Hydrogenophaga sp.]|jgi:hypothetical protein|nr:hypothetical protein [Hydrogenophaga sp.]